MSSRFKIIRTSPDGERDTWGQYGSKSAAIAELTLLNQGQMVKKHGFKFRIVDTNKETIEEGWLGDKWEVIWTDREYKKHRKVFAAELQARKFAKKLESDDAKSKYGEIRSIRVGTISSVTEDRVDAQKPPKKGTLKREIWDQKQKEHYASYAKDPHGNKTPADEKVAGPSGTSTLKKTNIEKPLGESLNEGLESGDLERLILPTIEIDVYSSKMGSDEDICTACFTVRGREPANDLVSFIEKGYNFVLDADNSSGENNDGDYQVFVEFERTRALPSQIIEILDDLANVTEHAVADWQFKYYKDPKKHDATEKLLNKHIIMTSAEYKNAAKQSQAADEQEIDDLKATSGVKIGKKDKKEKDDKLESIQALAGII